MAEEVKSELAATIDAIERVMCVSNVPRVTVSHAELKPLIAAARRAEEAERERCAALKEMAKARGLAQDAQLRVDFLVLDREEQAEERGGQFAKLWEGLKAAVKRAEKAEANYRFMVERAANEKLDGYRELGERAAKAENERDSMRLRAEQAERELAKLAQRKFPVLDPPLGCPSRVPWSFVAPHEGQALRNHDQTLERLAQRGGLGAEELVAVVRGERWRERTFKTEEDAAVELARMLSPLEENSRAATFLRTHGEAVGAALGLAANYETNQEWLGQYRAAAQALAEVMKNGQ